MSTKVPWSQISPGMARRVDADHVADFYWSVSAEGESELLLAFPATSESRLLPKLRGLVVKVVPHGDGRDRLVLRLIDPSLRDVFWRLCVDIIEASRMASGEESAAHIAIRRTWRWHHLLRGGGSELLSEEEQKGLLGEIHVVGHLLEFLPADLALDSWRGPLGAPKDFEIGPHGLEAKARRGAAAPHVSISSEHQLDGAGVNVLLLHVVDLSAAGDGLGLTLTDAALSLRDKIGQWDEGLTGPLEDRLIAAGFDWTADYSAFRWLEGRHRLYRVHKTFPRISAATKPLGVSRVRYEIDLHAIEDFEIDWQEASSLLLPPGGPQ